MLIKQSCTHSLGRNRTLVNRREIICSENTELICSRAQSIKGGLTPKNWRPGFSEKHGKKVEICYSIQVSWVEVYMCWYHKRKAGSGKKKDIKHQKKELYKSWLICTRYKV